MSSHNKRDALEQLDNLSLGGQDFDLSNHDLIVKTLTASGAIASTGGGMAGGGFTVLLAGTTAVTTHVWQNNTPVNITVAAVTILYSTVGGAGATLELRKAVTGTQTPASGVSLFNGGPVSLLGTVNLPINVGLTAVLADRIIAPGEKLGFLYAGTITGLVGMCTVSFA